MRRDDNSSSNSTAQRKTVSSKKKLVKGGGKRDFGDDNDYDDDDDDGDDGPVCLDCSPGWKEFDGSCYKMSHIRGSWTEASRSCHLQEVRIIECSRMFYSRLEILPRLDSKDS